MTEKAGEKALSQDERDQKNLVDFFDLLLKVDMRQNPDLFKNND